MGELFGAGQKEITPESLGNRAGWLCGPSNNWFGPFMACIGKQAEHSIFSQVHPYVIWGKQCSKSPELYND